MIRFSKLAAALAVVPVLAFASPALATTQSSVEGGDIYRVKNVTKNVDFTDPANADACDVLMYKVRIHNPGPTETLNNVKVVAAFGTAATTKNVSIVTVRADNASPSSTSDTATVNLSSSQTMSFVSGSTQLLDADGNVIQNLPDGITGNGVSIGNVGVSIGNKRFVQFQEKVSCPSAPKPVYSCDELTITNTGTRSYSYTVKATAKDGATITGYGFDFGDATTLNTTVNNATHTYAKDGTYTTKATVKFNIDNSQFTSACSKTITVSTPTTPTPTPTTPAPPATIPNTGAGDVLGIFAGASALGTAGHFAVARLRRGE